MELRGGLQGVMNRGFASIAVWCAKHPLTVVLCSLVALLIGLYGASLARQDNSLDAYFMEGDQSYKFYKDYIEEFSSDEVIYLLYDAPGTEHGPFDLEVMRKIGHLTEALEREVPFTRKVTSLANVEFIEAKGDEVEIHALLSDFPEDQAEMLRMRDVALSKPLYVNSIVSPDGKYGAIMVEMTRNSTDKIDQLRHDPKGGDALDNLYPQVPDKKMREILARPEYQGLHFWISGDVPMNSAYNVLIGEDIGVVTLLTFALVGAMSMVFLGVRPMGLLGPLLVVFSALILCVGFMGFAGLKINLFFLMVPTLICAMGVAQCVHMLLAWQKERAHTPADPVDAVRRTIIRIGVPCLLVAVTDAVGFLGMAVSELRALSEMAWYSAFGVMMTFVLALTLMFAVSARTKREVGLARPTWAVRKLQVFMKHLAEFNLNNRRLLLAVFAAVGCVALYGVSKLKVDFNFLEEFKPHIEWRVHTEHINDVMGGILSVVYVFHTEKTDGVKNLEVLRQVEALQKVADQQKSVQDSVSVVDIVKELNQAFHGGDPAWYKLPDDQELLAQLLLVYELSGGKEMNDVLNLDRSKTALQVRLKLVAASEVREFVDAMDAYVKGHTIPGVAVEVSGVGLLWVEMAQYISDTQVSGYALTFGVIALFMIAAFGSVKLGLLAMALNCFPIMLTLGLMGLLDWHLDYFRLLLATIAIGIAVDDTMHFVASFKHEFDRCGRYDEALRRAMPEIGPAMVAMTAILVVAFASYYASSMAIVASFGTLLMFTIAMAMIADLLLMPSLLLWLKPLGPERVPVLDPDTDAAPGMALKSETV
ncbi:MAG TPA: MMPL family transporter [Nevskiaceae bacterium]|nr:MMPL family transporter [Nevskiaceae bacterium]